MGGLYSGGLYLEVYDIFRYKYLYKREINIFNPIFSQLQCNMDVQDSFEEWDNSETMDMEEIKSAVNRRKEISEVNDEKSRDSEDEDDNEYENLRCKKCKKQYRIRSCFLKHQSNCDNTMKFQNRSNAIKMTPHQIKTREILTSLREDNYLSLTV